MVTIPYFRQKLITEKKIGSTENHVNNRIERCYRIPNNIINGRPTERRGQRFDGGGVSRSCAVLRTTAGDTNYSLILVKSKNVHFWRVKNHTRF